MVGVFGASVGGREPRSRDPVDMAGCGGVQGSVNT